MSTYVLHLDLYWSSNILHPYRLNLQTCGIWVAKAFNFVYQ